MTPMLTGRAWRGLRLAMPAALIVLLLVTVRPAVAVETGFINGTAEAGGRSMPYVVYVPRSYTQAQQWPVILFRSRLYLTGLSMGGDGTWEIAAAHPDLFAAAIPICGFVDPRKVAPALKSLPIWAFQGETDPFLPAQFARDLVAAIQAAGNPSIRYTEYPGVGHNAWDRTYSNPEVIAWLLAQKR